jgi:hypothetical protein
MQEIAIKSPESRTIQLGLVDVHRDNSPFYQAMCNKHGKDHIREGTIERKLIGSRERPIIFDNKVHDEFG